MPPSSSRVVERRARRRCARARHRARSAARRAAGCPRPRGRRGAAPRLREQPLLLGGEHAVARRGPGTRGRAASRAPSARRAAATRPAAKSTKDVVDSISSLNASRPRSRPRSPRTWRHIASSSASATRGSCRLRRPCDISWRRTRPSWPRSSTITSSRQKIRNSRRAAGRLLPRRTTHQLGHPGRALDVGDRRLVVAGGADAVDDLAERPQRDRGLAEGRQHPLDVAHEDAARADDQHAAALVAAAVGVEQVRRAVQRDHGLAGAGAAGDRDHALGRAPGSPCPARPGWWPRWSASSGRGRARAGRSARPRRRSAGRSPASASSSSSSTPTTVGPALRSTRRRTTRCGSAAVAW